MVGQRTSESRPTPRRIVAVAATQRTGSYLLCYGLGAVGLAQPDRSHPWEILLPWNVFHGEVPKPRILQARLNLGRLARWWTTSVPGHRRLRTTRGARRAWFDFLASTYTSPEGDLAVKLMWGQYEQGMLCDGFDMSYWNAPVTWVYMSRRDVVRQAVSLVRSEQTQHWRSDDRLPAALHVEPHYDAERIADRIQALTSARAAWQRYFESIDVHPYEVVYEDLDADYEGTMRALLDHLGLPTAEVPARQLQRQSDAVNDEWVERFLAEQVANS